MSPGDDGDGDSEGGCEASPSEEVVAGEPVSAGVQQMADVSRTDPPHQGGPEEFELSSSEAGSASSLGNQHSSGWYSADEAAVNQRLESDPSQQEAASLGPVQAEGRFAWGSLVERMGRLSSKARMIIAEEAFTFAEEARDLAVGVREGVNLTVKDSIAVGEAARLWVLGAAGRPGSPNKFPASAQDEGGCQADLAQPDTDSIFEIGGSDDPDAVSDVEAPSPETPSAAAVTDDADSNESGDA